MKTKFTLLVTTALLLALPHFGIGQNSGVKNILQKTYLGVDIGSSLYYGDVRMYRFYPVYRDHSEYGWSASTNLFYDVLPWLTVRGQILGGTIAGTYRPAQLAFDGKYLDVNLGTMIDFVKMFTPDSRYSGYLFGGVGYFRYWADLNDLRYFTSSSPELFEGALREKNGKETSTHFGLGFGYEINDFISLYGEGSLRPVLSDWIDGVKKGSSEIDFVQYVNVGIKFRLARKKEEVRTATLTPKNPDPLQKVNERIKEQEKKNQEVEKPVTPTVVKKETPKPEPKPEPKPQPKETIIQEVERVIEPQPQPQETHYVEVVETPVQQVENYLRYRVQIAASRNKRLSIENLANKYGIYENIYETRQGNWYLYSVGDFDYREDALSYVNFVKDNYKVRGAFLSVYDNNVRIEPQLNSTRRSYTRSRSYNNNSSTGSNSYYGSSNASRKRSYGSSSATGTNRVYKIQFLALRESMKSTSQIQRRYNLDEEVSLYQGETWNIYTVHSTSSLSDARALLREFKNKYNIAAVIVAFDNGGDPIPVF